MRAYPVSCHVAGGDEKVTKSRVTTANMRAYRSPEVCEASSYRREAKNTTYDCSSSSQYASGAHVMPASGWLIVIPVFSPLVRFQSTMSVDSHTFTLRL